MTLAENPFAISVAAADDSAAVVSLTGELDVATGAEVRACLADLLAAGSDVVVDLTGLTFMDSTGISVLIGAHKRAALQERSFMLRGASTGVARVLQISGVDQVFKFADAD